MENLKIEYLGIDEIKPYKRNAKLHPKEQVEQIKASMLEMGDGDALKGFLDPIGIWGDENEIVEGHGRHMAAKELGLETVPVIRLDRLTDEQRRAYALIHNQLTMNSGFDLDALNIELGDIELDMSAFGFELDSEEEPQEAVEDDYDPEPPSEPEAKRGAIYQLGRHRLMCGDSTMIDDVEKLMGGGRRQICFLLTRRTMSRLGWEEVLTRRESVTEEPMVL